MTFSWESVTYVSWVTLTFLAEILTLIFDLSFEVICVFVVLLLPTKEDREHTQMIEYKKSVTIVCQESIHGSVGGGRGSLGIYILCSFC